MSIDQEIKQRENDLTNLYKLKEQNKIDKKLKCKHKLSDLRFERMYKSSPDGYGGDNEWEWYDLECRCCEKRIEVKESTNRPSWTISNEEYSSLCGRDLDPRELKKVFKENRTLYNRFKIDSVSHDLLLRELNYRTDDLDKKIERKRKLIKKHNIELEKMLNKYNGED